MDDRSERIPPHNLDSEMACLGSMILGGYPVIDEIAEVLDGPDDFYQPNHIRLYAMLIDMRERESKIDLVTVLDRVKCDVVDADWAYLVGLCESLTHHSLGSAYAIDVARHARRRRCLRIAISLEEESYNLRNDIDVVMATAASKLDDSVRSVGKAVYDTQELLDDYPSELAAKSRHGPVKSHFNPFDDEYGGLERGSLHILGARPSIGKTTVGMQWAILAARSGNPALFVSVEMSKAMINERLVAFLGCEVKSVVRTLGTAEIAGLCTLAKKHISGGYLGIVIGRSYMRDIISIIRTQVRTRKISLVVVDYLQLCRLGEKAERRDLEIDYMAQDLKNVAIETNVAMVVCAQLGRAVERAQRAPILSDLRESGALEQHADVVSFLHRDKIGEHEIMNTCKLIVAKYRNGRCMDFGIEFNHGLHRVQSKGCNDGWAACEAAQAVDGEGDDEPGQAPVSFLRAVPASAYTQDDDIPF